MSLGSTASSFLTGTGVLSATLLLAVAREGPAPEWAPLVAGGTSAGLVSGLFVFVLRRTTESHERIVDKFSAAIKDVTEKHEAAGNRFAETIRTLQSQLIEALKDANRDRERS